MSLFDFLGIIVIISFFIRSIRNVLYMVFLWQLKEYRLDRFLAHLKTPQGKKLLFGPITLVKWILFLGILTGFDIYFYYIFWLVWIIESILNIRELVLYRWRLPQFTIKMIFILFVIFFIISVFLLKDFTDIIFEILIRGVYIDRFISLAIPIIIGLLSLPVFLYKYLIIWRAEKKIFAFNNLIVIGITGSYGKTSTKEFLATILNEKFKVAKTPEFTNTDIGIAQYILRELNPDHEIFVVEMGAYKKGEIKTICDMVKPQIGVITGINEQHLELFGSIENTKRAKFELIESLPKNGEAFFSGNNIHCLEMAKWAERRRLKTVTYKTASDVKNIEIFSDHIAFTLTSGNKSYKFQIKLLGIQSIENILGAIYIAKDLGMTIEEMQKVSSRIVSPLKTMQFKGMENGVTLIDDTFNANPDGVIAVLDYMKIFKGKKILVLTPLIELGDYSVDIHNKLGKKAAEICDEIYLTNKNFWQAIYEGASEVAEGENKLHVGNLTNLINSIHGNLLKDAIIIFEGKEAGRILHQLTNNN